MTAIDVLTVVYLSAFQLCAVPALVRLWRRRSSNDLSMWREGLLLIGVGAQWGVMVLTGADWRVWISPILSGLNATAVLVTIRHFRS